MTPVELSKQEDHLFAVLSGRRFLQMEGLSNEVPFFIYPYALRTRLRSPSPRTHQEPADQPGH